MQKERANYTNIPKTIKALRDKNALKIKRNLSEKFNGQNKNR